MFSDLADLPVTRPELRRLLSRLYTTDEEFEALCIDYEPLAKVHQRFSRGMDRLSKTNLLLQLVPPEQLLAILRLDHADRGDVESMLAQVCDSPSHRRDSEREKLALRLEALLLQRDRKLSQGAYSEIPTLDAELVQLKRQLRRGPQLQEGEVLADRYILRQRVGKGGYGEVWQVFDRVRQQLLAAKVLHGRREDEHSLQRFDRGARILQRLDHPHLVKVFEPPSDHEGFHYYVMEYLPGGDLQQAVCAGRLDRQRALNVVLQAGEALEFAHQAGLVHRDVKPMNILLDAEGHARLCDFDLASTRDSTGGTASGAAIGTFLYAAPESLEDGRSADRRSDVYSLGMTLLFVLYGRPLPTRAIQRGAALALELGCAASLLSIIARATNPNPNERYGRVAELCDALSKVLAGSADDVTPLPSLLPAVEEAASHYAQPASTQETPTLIAVRPNVAHSKLRRIRPRFVAAGLAAILPAMLALAFHSIAARQAPSAPQPQQSSPQPTANPSPPLFDTASQPTPPDVLSHGESLSDSPPETRDKGKPATQGPDSQSPPRRAQKDAGTKRRMPPQKPGKLAKQPPSSAATQSMISRSDDDLENLEK